MDAKKEDVGFGLFSGGGGGESRSPPPGECSVSRAVLRVFVQRVGAYVRRSAFNKT